MTPRPGSHRAASLAFVALALASLAVASAATGKEAEPVHCTSGKAVVSGASAADFADVCAGADAAASFLASHGVEAVEPVVIEVTNSIPAEAGPTAAGCYMEHSRRVYVLPFVAFKRKETWFGVRIDREMFRALVAHETAHAVAACGFRIAHPTIQAKEYIAYVTMFSVMSAKLRTAALRNVRTKGFQSLDRFTPLLYSFDPMRFGAEAYRHYSASSARTELIQSILSGKALTD